GMPRTPSLRTELAQAASDPGASRPGDDQMSCEQITAELRQQQYSAPDQSKVAESQETVAQEQSMFKRHYAEMLKQQAEDQALMNTASAADTAPEIAGGGLVRGRAIDAAQKTVSARDQALNDRMVKESQPVTQKLTGQTADFGAQMGQQLESNPHLARSIALATARHCKGGG
ncbi:MAG TPA: hypothetical protein VN859_06295, partial [Steroidobacteraceae bacterium]|nr:hypothetical protein [Steroidobacteraceae bacterium]